MVDIKKWQSVWCKILNMAYYGTDMTEFIVVNEENYNELYEMYRNDPKFEELTFDYMWKLYSNQYDFTGEWFIEPSVVNDLKHLHVPKLLFRSLGVEKFMDACFPNCTITYWEDDVSPV